MSRESNRIFIASLFLPYTLSNEGTPIRSKQGNIGLQNAVTSANLESALWIGTTGLTKPKDCKAAESQLRKHSCIPVFPSDEEMIGHYHEFCKQILWRTFHYQLQEYPKSISFEEKAWDHYVRVNQLFTEKILEYHNPGDFIWINDYHLMLVPSMLRKLLPSAKIGFFLHIPFPRADLIGFQTYSFMRHFLMTCTRILSLECTPQGIQLDDALVTVGIFPIGINLVSLNEKRANPRVPEMIASLKEKYSGKKIIIGRDKNDYVKGVRQKMLAFERFLFKYPQWRVNVVLIQVMLSTTEINANESGVSEVVSRINSKYGTIEYSPVVYLQQDIDFSHYLALLTMADACLITSLRDGMNLTSHEYVVCQSERHSPLIISEFTGTYGNFGAALRINPWDTSEVADAMNEALTMTQEDKFTRWNELYAYVSNNTSQNYAKYFIHETEEAHREHEQTISTSLPVLPPALVAAAYFERIGRRMILLDHDGTLIPIPMPTKKVIPASVVDVSAIGTSRAASVTLSPTLPTSSSLKLIRKLAADPRNIVYVVSNRMKDNLVEFEDIPNLGISAENGGFIRYAATYAWEADEIDLSWRATVMEILEYYTEFVTID